MRGICGSAGRDALRKDFETLRQQERQIVESKVKLSIKVFYTVCGHLFGLKTLKVSTIY